MPIMLELLHLGTRRVRSPITTMSGSTGRWFGLKIDEAKGPEERIFIVYGSKDQIS